MLGCEPFGEVSKITIFDTNPNGIVVVKFTTSTAAENVWVCAAVSHCL